MRLQVQTNQLSGENKKPFTRDNHHGLLQYKYGLLWQKKIKLVTTINLGHVPADQKQNNMCKICKKFKRP